MSRLYISHDPVNVIRSCRTPDQVLAATFYAQLWIRKHGLAPMGETFQALHWEVTRQILSVLGNGPGKGEGKRLVQHGHEHRAHGKEEREPCYQQ